jgi:predicted ATPase
MEMYIAWLGFKTVPRLRGVLEDELETIRARADFVNDMMSQSLFGSRRYKVKPAMWMITTKTLLHRDRTKEEMYEYEEDETETLKVQLYVEDQNGRRLDFHEVGSGISYVMPILVSLHGAKTSWVAQPELHLHPAAQCEMGDVFLRAYHRQHFSVVETHSEHLLLRVLKRIRETTRGADIDDDLKCLPEAVSILYFDPKEDGSTEIRQMRVSRQGDFMDRWPNGFFEERGRELFDE